MSQKATLGVHQDDFHRLKSLSVRGNLRVAAQASIEPVCPTSDESDQLETLEEQWQGQGGEHAATPLSEIEQPKSQPVEHVPFIERQSVSSFFAALVVVNSIYMGIDTHLRAKNGEDAMGLFGTIVDSMFLVMFTVEVVLKMWNEGCPSYFTQMWNVLDLSLVLASIFDMAVLLVAGGGPQQDFGKLRAMRLVKITKFARVVRLLRVFRLKKIMRLTRSLILLLQALAQVLEPMGWMFVLFAGMLYILGIITTEFIGLVNEDGDTQIEEWFGDLWKSMFTLYQISTLSDWTVVSRHIALKKSFVWNIFFLVYVFFTNLIIMNLALACLLESLFCLSADLKDAQSGVLEEPASWMKTPSSLASESSGEEEADSQESEEDAVAGLSANFHLGQALGDLFDLFSTFTGGDGTNNKRLITLKSLKDALHRPEVKTKLTLACPSITNVPDGAPPLEPEKIAQTIWGACPRQLDPHGMNKQELAEACMALMGELSLNHFVVISQTLVKTEQQVSRQLEQLNSQQRRLNRRFIKMRHRLRKVYRFDGSPRKMQKLMDEKREKLSERQRAGLSSAAAAPSGATAGNVKPQRPSNVTQGADDASNSEASSASVAEDTKKKTKSRSNKR
eukprot:TRINITY_DN18347_c0_g2_i1.p1 TRINITY_DN18347_c0_g2~~TRINITY_DN18347_c0_g2_i1.p1  ORF type:complete len:619 (-),score=122.04 TRINITY_DN18347_c0_g2_i1:98-1954(-)